MAVERSSSSTKRSRNQADPTKTRASRKKTKGKNSGEAGAQPTAADLLQHSSVTTEEWYKSQRTTSAYANYVKSGKKWLGDWVSEDRQGPGVQSAENGGAGRDAAVGDPPSSSTSAIEDRESFAGAFDTLSGKTPIALRLLLAFKCDVQQNGFSTAEGIRSAFKQYFER